MAKHDSCSIDSRLAKYGAMSLAVASGVLAGPAHASVITTLASSACPTTDSTTGGTVYFNPMTQTCGSNATGALFEIHNFNGFGGTNILGASGMTSHAALAAGSNFLLAKLAASGTAGFSTNLSFQGHGAFETSGGAGNWHSGDTDYIGLEMDASGFHYGWAQVQISGYEATLLEFAYNTSAGSAPGTGTAPEPSSFVMLALGAAGIALYRRKKAKAA